MYGLFNTLQKKEAYRSTYILHIYIHTNIYLHTYIHKNTKTLQSFIHIYTYGWFTNIIIGM